jgi:class 3 adenylate cyclase/tetratricopeptide (TPR) repeat protein
MVHPRVTRANCDERKSIMTLPSDREIVDDILRRAGLADMADHFVENGIDEISLLCELDGDDLRELGLNIGQRKRLKREIANLSTPKSQVGDAMEVRRVTVLFCDLAGSTALSQRVDAGQLYEILQEYYGLVGQVTRSHGGFIATLQGDGILVLFGYPKTSGANAENAIGAGLAILDAVTSYQHRLADGSIVTLGARVGIATGSTVIGWSREGFLTEEVHVVGATPNTAARLQSAAETGWVLIDDATRDLVGDIFDLERLPPADLKGMVEPFPISRALRRTHAVDRFTALKRTKTKLVGRVTERTKLKELWADAKLGNTALVNLVSEAGIGKSRLVRELETIAGADGGQVIQLACSPQFSQSPLQPVIALLETVVGRSSDSSQRTRQEALGYALRGLCDQDIQTIGRLVEIGLVDEATFEQSSAEARTELLQALSRWLTMAQQQAVLLTLEDAQWADPTTMELMQLCTETAKGQRVFILVASRNLENTRQHDLKLDVTLHLSPLERADCLDLLKELTTGQRLPDDAIEAILERADGNPLLLEELLKSASDSVDDGATFDWHVPASLYDSVVDRLDRLQRGREVAATASVFGRSAPIDVLGTILGLTDTQVRASIAHLRAAEIFDPARPHFDTFVRFRHSLVRDALYERLIDGKRKQLHSHIFAMLEKRDVDSPDHHPEILSWHAFEAGAFEDAAQLALRAGDSAADRAALVEATYHLEHSRRALALLPEDEAHDRLRLRTTTSLTAVKRSRFGISSPEVGDLGNVVLELAQRLGDTHSELLALNGIFSFHLVKADFQNARIWGTRLLETAREAGNEMFEMTGLRSAGFLSMYLGEFDASARHLHEALARYDQDRHDELIRTHGYDHAEISSSFLAHTLWMQGDLQGAWKATDFAVRHSEKIDHKHSLAQALSFQGLLGMLAHHMGADADCAERAEEIGGHFGFKMMEAGGRYFKEVWRYFRINSMPSGSKTRDLLDALNDLEVVMPNNYGPLLRLCAADCLILRGELDLAEEYIGLAVEMQHKTGEIWTQAEVARLHASLLIARKDETGARKELLAAYDLAVNIGANTIALRIATDLVGFDHDASTFDRLQEAECRMISLDDGWDVRRLKEAKEKFAAFAPG